MQGVRMRPWLLVTFALVGCVEEPASPREARADMEREAAERREEREQRLAAESTRQRLEAEQSAHLARAREWVRAREAERHGRFTCPVSADLGAVIDATRNDRCWDDTGRAEAEAREAAANVAARCRALLDAKCEQSRAQREASRPERVARRAERERQLEWVRAHCRRIPSVATGDDAYVVGPDGRVRRDTPVIAFSGDMYQCEKNAPKEMRDIALRGQRSLAITSEEREDSACAADDAAARECIQKIRDRIIAP